MKANGKMTRVRDMDASHALLKLTLESGLMMFITEMVKKNGKTVAHSKANTPTEKKTDLEFTHSLMELHITATGSAAKCEAKALINGPTIVPTRVSG